MPASSPAPVTTTAPMSVVGEPRQESLAAKSSMRTRTKDASKTASKPLDVNPISTAPPADDQIHMLFPKSFLKPGEIGADIWPFAEQLYFPEAENRLDDRSADDIGTHVVSMAIHNLQAAFGARESVLRHAREVSLLRLQMEKAMRAKREAEGRVAGLMKDLEEYEGVQAKLEATSHDLVQAQATLKSVEEELEQANKALEEKTRELESTIASANDDKTTKDATIADLRREIEALKAALEASREETNSVAQEAKENEAYIVMWTRARLMKEVVDGKSSEWKPQEEVDEFVALAGESELGEGEGDGDGDDNGVDDAAADASTADSGISTDAP